MKASQIMSKNVITVKRDTTIEDIAHILTNNNISGVPVVDDENKVVGMVTEKDLLYKDIEPHFPPVIEILGGLIFLKGVKKYNEELRKLVATKAEDIMTKDTITVEEDMTVGRIAELMIEKEVNRLPVLKDDKLTGIISRADVVRSMSEMFE